MNPVANDTESQVPRSRKAGAEAGRPRRPERNCAQKPNPQKKPSPDAAPQKYSPIRSPTNQVYSSTGQALTSPMFSQAPGGGGVGSGSSSPFGNRFG